MQIDRVGRGAAAPDGEACGRAGRSAARAGRRRRPGRRSRRRRPAAGRTTSAPHGVRARGEHGGRARQRGARAALGHAEHALAPALLGRHERVRARRRRCSPPSTRSMPSSPARPRMSSRPEMSRSSSACRKPASACSDARSGARRRSTSEAISVVTSLTSAAPASPRRAAAACPTGASATRSSMRLDPGGVVEQRPLVGRRARRHGQHGARAVGQHQAGVERPSGGTDDLGQAGTGLDGVGDRVQRGEIEPGRRSVGRGGHAPIRGETSC